MDNLTVVYYTANVIPEMFAKRVRHYIKHAVRDTPIISVSKQSVEMGENIVVDTPRSHISIYQDALTGVKAAKTKYIALCEDDVLYSPQHFHHVPTPGKFAYNLSCWSVFTWGYPMFTHKGKVRRNLSQLICERDLFIEAIEERFATNNRREELWSELGKYEDQLGVTVRETEEFYTNPANIVFSHQTALSFDGLGTRKRVGEYRALELPNWGKASDVVGLYK